MSSENERAPIMTADEAAALKGVQRSTIYSAMAAGKITYEQLGRTKMPHRASVEAWTPASYNNVVRAKVRRGAHGKVENKEIR